MVPNKCTFPVLFENHLTQLSEDVTKFYFFFKSDVDTNENTGCLFKCPKIASVSF